MSLTKRLSRTLLPLGLGLLSSAALHGAGEVSSVETVESGATPFRYVANGNTYTWGLGNNQVLQGFVSGGQSYRYASSADRVELMRDDIVGVTDGLPCGIFVERFGSSSRTLAADYPTDASGTGNCDMGALLASRTVNRGAVDLFSNKLPDAKNIERIDYLFDRGVLAPLGEAAREQAGHLVAEKKGNNPVSIAAVLELDILGQPAAYGPLVTIGATGCMDPALCYGLTDLQHDYAFFQNSLTAPQGFPVVTETSRESVGMAFVSSAQLGLAAGQRYFGFSLFADDVDPTTHDLLDPATFPDDTADDNIVVGDDADIYGGLTGYFVGELVSVATGRVFLDEDGNGLPDDDEAGISDITVSIFVDTDGNGLFDPEIDTLLGEPTDSDVSGGFFLPGLPDGDYLVFIDETDEDLPSGLQLQAGSNPRPVTVAGGSPDDVYFVFEDPNAPAGGSDSGTETAGAATAGTDTGTDASSTGGESTGGQSTEGESTVGENTGGESTSGETSSETGGATTSGEQTGGAATVGSATGGSDSGEQPSGGATSGESTSGTTTSGEGTAGEATGGQPTDGTTTSGTATSGDTSSGEATGGQSAGETTGGETTGGEDPTPPDGTPRDDVNTTAFNDEFTVNQGSVDNELEVLENDNDGAGDGLTIESVSESGNATITIIENEVVYTPDPEFNGVDNFIYEIADGDNTVVSGSVTVTVLRFSDINNNGLNDFVECDCTSLTLETGVNGSGVGQVSLAFIALLGMLMALRGRLRFMVRRRFAFNRTKA